MAARRRSQRERAATLRDKNARAVVGVELVATISPYYDIYLRGDKGFRNRKVGKPRPDYVHETPGKLSDEDVREVRRRAGWGYMYADIAAFFGSNREYIKAVANYRARKRVK